MSLLGGLTGLLSGGVEALGYPGIFVLMLIEGVITPIPSEVILPFAGSLARSGQFDLVAVILIATVGATLGSGGAYQLGMRLGRPFVLRWGRYIMLDVSDLDRAERWFRKWGTLGVFLGMSVPGARSIVAYPAGAGRMPFVPFLAATFGGALIWNSVLAVAGWFLLDEWTRIVDTFEFVDLVVIALLVVVVVVYILYKWRLRANAEVPDEGRGDQ